MLDLLIRLDHGCQVAELSRRHPAVDIATWCNFRLDLLELHGTPGDLGGLLDDLASIEAHGFPVLSVLDRGPEDALLALGCGHEREPDLDADVNAAGGFLVPPVLVQGGSELYRIIVPDDETAARVFDVFATEGRAELLRKRPREGVLTNQELVVAIQDLLASLTAKQAEAVIAAVAKGYYRVPRGTTLGEVAAARDTARTTFEEHLRKGEAKIVRAVAPYVALWASDRFGGSDVVAPAARP